jgi:hypothetical protein
MALAIQLQGPVPAAHVVSPKPAVSVRGAEQSVLRPHSIRAEDDWLRAIVSEDRHLNVLVHCPDLPMASVIAEIGELCGRPVWTSLVPVLQLPEHDGETVVIGDISTMSLLQQVELHEWLDRFGGTSQVLSFSSAPLWPLVERGRFLADLFYRLNVVTLTADPIRH